jgi:hypothetical protein
MCPEYGVTYLSGRTLIKRELLASRPALMAPLIP